MSSLRNAVKRITHKERSQPRHRAKLGFLEKHKDYKERATDYHRKQDRLNTMQLAAKTRNPDEFYFAMQRAQVKDGKHRTLEEAQAKPDHATIQALKAQDLHFVRMQKQKDVKQLEKNVHMLLDKNDDGRQHSNRHVIFVESAQEAQTFDAARHFDTPAQLMHRRSNRPRTGAVADATIATPIKVVKAAAKERKKAQHEMLARTKRLGQLEQAEAHLVTERWLAGNGQKRKICEAQNGQPAQYQWRRKRQR